MWSGVESAARGTWITSLQTPPDRKRITRKGEFQYRTSGYALMWFAMLQNLHEPGTYRGCFRLLVKWPTVLIVALLLKISVFRLGYDHKTPAYDRREKDVDRRRNRQQKEDDMEEKFAMKWIGGSELKNERLTRLEREKTRDRRMREERERKEQEKRRKEEERQQKKALARQQRKEEEKRQQSQQARSEVADEISVKIQKGPKPTTITVRLTNSKHHTKDSTPQEQDTVSTPVKVEGQPTTDVDPRNLPANQNIEVVADLKLFKDNLLSNGRGTAVYKGVFEGSIPVAVKKIHLTSPQYSSELRDNVKILREVETLRKMPEFNHHNIVRFLKSETTPDFLYIAFELCQGTLEDYVDKQANWGEELYWKCVLIQMTSALHFLHAAVKLAHRDLKPCNVLLYQTELVTKVVLADFGQSKMMANEQCSMSGTAGSLGWIAPEVDAIGDRYYTESDIFSLGCLFYFVVTKGKHPYGEGPYLKRQINIFHHKSDLKAIQPSLLCLKELISTMIKPTHGDRPSAKEVSEHPSLFDDEVIMDFLHKASNQINSYPVTDKNILEDPSIIPNGNWIQMLPINTCTYLSRLKLPRNNQPMFQGKQGSVRHLLRAIRNCSEHFKDLDATVRTEMGASTSDHVEFWLKHFPWLLTHVYNKMKGDRSLMKSIRKS